MVVAECDGKRNCSNVQLLTEQGVLKGDPAAAQQLRRQVLDDLEEVREEIEELLEVKVG